MLYYIQKALAHKSPPEGLWKGIKMKKQKGFNAPSYLGYLCLGVLLLVIGVCFIAFTEALDALAIAIGVVLSLSAAIIALLALANANRGFTFAVKITLAVITLVGGITVIVCRSAAIDVMTAVFGLILIIDASIKLNTAALCKRYAVKAWWLPFSLSVITIGLSFYLTKYAPVNNMKLLTILLGSAFVIDAIHNLISIIFVPKYLSKQSAAIYYDTYRTQFKDQDDSEEESESTEL